MNEQVKKILDKIRDWWIKFDRKQKGIILSAFSVVLIMVLILVVILNHTTYEVLKECEDTFTASQVVELLKENGIEYKTSKDGKTIEVSEKDVATASLILGANQIEAQGYSFDNVVDSSFTTTESDRQAKRQKYLESKLEMDLAKIAGIDSASVTFYIPESSGTLISNNEQSYAAIYLDTTEEFKIETAEAIAKTAAFLLGNDTTDQISIMDNTTGNLIYPVVVKEPDEEETAVLDVSNQLAFQAQLEQIVKDEVKDVVLGTGAYSNVSVSTRLVLNWDKVKSVVHDYEAAEGQDQGVLSHEDYYESNSQSQTDAAAVPGTSSNDSTGTTYVTGDKTDSDEEYTKQWSKDFLPKESIIETTNALGSIEQESSYVSLSAYSYKVYKEEEVENQGLLAEMSWEEFKALNSERTKIEVDEDLYKLVAFAAGVPVANVAITAYQEPVFCDRVIEASDVSASDIIVIVLTVLILGLLGFVVWKSVAGERRKKTVVEEEELSVESMLQSEPLEIADIEVETKSETRLMIEKFVTDNPEAAAILLRNWIEEEWGM